MIDLFHLNHITIIELESIMSIPEPSAVPPVVPGTPAPQGSSNRKLWIILAIVAVVLCLGACIVAVLIGRGAYSMAQNSLVEDPQQAAEMGAEVAEFDLPDGFEPVGGMDLMGVKMAIYQSQSDETMISLMRIPGQGSLDNANTDSMVEQMTRQMGRQMNDVRLIDQYETTIRGKPAQVLIQEGTSSEGVLSRMMFVVFEGKSGVSLMMIMSPADAWDQEMADGIVESIR